MKNKTKIIIGVSALVLIGIGYYIYSSKKNKNAVGAGDSGSGNLGSDDKSDSPTGSTTGSTSGSPTSPLCKYDNKFIRGSKGIVYWVRREGRECVKYKWTWKTSDSKYAWANSIVIPDAEVDKIRTGK